MGKKRYPDQFRKNLRWRLFDGTVKIIYTFRNIVIPVQQKSTVR